MLKATLVNTKRLLTLATAKPEIKEELGQALASRVLAATKPLLFPFETSIHPTEDHRGPTKSAPS